MSTLIVDNITTAQSVSKVTLSASDLIEKVEFFDEVSDHVKGEFRDWVKEQFSDLTSQIDNLPELLNQMQSDLINSVPIEQIEIIISLLS
ncbi:hypothetical protein ESZ36_19515 [Colwellia demingiae]|uniref:Uncharacterized protein n=1 Tax=Colwellia demingiae TaxID=89401 RepID=A0A5C6Q710_9GAMM|nr:hypothetical protein [Colwellia demingiae]TWX64502.1 hypothetical protein ESZ36_19515 [Colwellia demingiae]